MDNYITTIIDNICYIFDEELQQKIMKLLTIKIKNTIGSMSTFSIFFKTEKILIVPMSILTANEQLEFQSVIQCRKKKIKNLITITNCRIIKRDIQPLNITIKNLFFFPTELSQKPYQYQQEMITNLLDKSLQSRSILLYASTGSGKTKTLIFSLQQYEVLQSINISIIIVVFTKQLQQQWYDQLVDIFGALWTKQNVTICNSTTKDTTKRKIMIYTLQGLSRQLQNLLDNQMSHKIPNEYFCDFLILDEAHLYRTAHYTTLVFLMNYRYLIGCTATPYTGMTKCEINQFFIGMCFTAVVKFYCEISNQRQVKKINYYSEEQKEMIIVRKDGIINMMSTLQLIHNDQQRIKFILQLLKECLLAKKRVIVFAITREYLEAIFAELTIDNSINSNCHLFYGGLKKDATDKITKQANQDENELLLLTTFKFGSVGLDIKNMNTIVLVDSTKSQIEQIIGRIGRNTTNNLSPVVLEIYDIIDVYHFTSKHFTVRKKVYQKHNYQILE